MRLFAFATAAFCAIAPLRAQPPVRWNTSLSDAGGGYWRARVPIVVTNDAAEPAAGLPVALVVGPERGQLPLAGMRVASLRVCSDAGAEYLYQVSPRTPGRRDLLADGDVVRFAVDVPAHAHATYYVYADNPDAARPLDYLKVAVENGGFEADGTHPAGWVSAVTDALHIADYLAAAGRGGSRCAHVRVAPGAPAAWVSWNQLGIRVTPGRRYTLAGWIRARGITGAAGFYAHVNGAKPMVVNRVLDAGPGDYDWREIRNTIVVPAGCDTIDLGTVLYGTGEAWYDDVSLTEEGAGAGGLRAEAGAMERLRLTAAPLDGRWRPLTGGAWPVRAQVRVLNADDSWAQGLVVSADLRRAVHMLRRSGPPGRLDLRAQVVDPEVGRALPSVRVADRLCFSADLPPHSERRYFVYLARAPKPVDNLSAHARLVRSPANLAREGDFEDAARAAAAWPTGAEGQGAKPGYEARVVDEGLIGRRCLRLTVPPDAPLRWTGWRQTGIRITPNTTYLYAGYVRTRGVTGGAVALHAHFLAADGSLAKDGAFYSTGDSIAGTTGWTLCAGTVTAPADAATAELHLTMNARGTVWHDGIVFVEAAEGRVARVEGLRAVVAPPAFAAWPVNPLVKVFPDDPPAGAGAVAISAARREWEPFQIALWSRTPLRDVRAEAAALRGPGGRALPLRSFRVATVPVDRPSAYYQSRLPDYRRRIPSGSGATDGWAGEWPDPLPPLRPFDLPARRTQALWFDVFVPEQAPPGDYRGIVTVRAAGRSPLRIPVRLHVWDFALPEERHLKVVYDLRSGPGWDVTHGDDPATLRRWYRFLAEHRVCPDTIHPEPSFRYENGKVVMDAARFDEMAAYCFDTLKMNHAYTPGLFYALGWAYGPQAIFGLKPRTPEYEAAWKDAYRLFIEHVTARGWRDRFVHYLSDEPFFDYPQVVADLRYVADMARSVAPDIPIYSSTWRHSPGLDGVVSLWGIGQYGCFPVDTLRDRLRAGDHALFTTDGQQALDTPYLATERLLPAYCLKYGVGGFEFWGVSWWTHDPWDRAWHQYIRQSDQGSDYYWIRYPNGDGYLTYPGERVGVEGPVGSIRLEAVREGAEDYEYYLLLDQRMREGRARGRSVAAAARALDAVRSLVSIPNPGGLRSTQLLPDPDAVYRARRAVAEQIVALGAPPRRSGP